MTAFAPTLLPDSEKQVLCERLLEEFGIPIARITSKGEIHMPCPFGIHSDQEKNPTGSLNYTKLTYKCLGCQAAGGLIWFVASLRNSSVVEAREWLGKATGTNGEAMDLSDLLRLFDAIYTDTAKNKIPIPHYSMKILEPWFFIHPYMTDPVEQGGRGIAEETYKHFCLGYAKDYRVEGNRTSERIIIPHFWQGQLVGWQSRRLSNDGTPKYLNSPDFPKDQTLFNYDSLAKVAIVVESPMSVLKHWEEIPEMVCTFGASVTDEQIRLLKRIPKVVLWMDDDEAGWSATNNMQEKLSPYTDVFIVEGKINKDPADFSTQEAVEKIANAVPFSVWNPLKRLGVTKNGAA